MPDDVPLTITLPPADWQVIRAGLYELPMKHAAQVVFRLETALAEAQKPEVPHIVKGGKT